MTDILLSDSDLSKGGNVTVYDMTMGTSQMLSCMEECVHELNADIDITCFGQESNPFTFAIEMADMMIRGGDPNNIFPAAFGTAAMESFMEFQESYSALFEDQSKYYAVMSALAGVIYHEMRQIAVM